jgi:hypothetical protein
MNSRIRYKALALKNQLQLRLESLQRNLDTPAKILIAIAYIQTSGLVVVWLLICIHWILAVGWVGVFFVYWCAVHYVRWLRSPERAGKGRVFDDKWYEGKQKAERPV